jgi:uncharacterized membrane protein YwaF
MELLQQVAMVAMELLYLLLAHLFIMAAAAAVEIIHFPQRMGKRQVVSAAAVILAHQLSR